MDKSKASRGVKCVNVEVPTEMLGWMDKVASELESSRGGVVRIALKQMKAQTDEQSPRTKQAPCRKGA